MPARSQAQRGLIFSKRDQYGSKAKTPDKWKWIWDEDFENKGKLPKKVKNETVQNMVVVENTRARFVNENMNDPRDYNGEVWGFLENALSLEELEYAQDDMNLNREIELARVNGYDPEDAATQILTLINPQMPY